VGVNNCDHDEDVGVRCMAPGTCRDNTQCAAGEFCLNGVCSGADRHVMLCGSSDRDVASFLDPADHLDVVAGCAPDATTQVLVITRSGQYDPQAVSTFVRFGGIVVTEYSTTAAVYNAVTDGGVAEGNGYGDCQDIVNPVVRQNEMDPFWIANGDLPLEVEGNTGCGMDMSAYPGITPLGGWDANSVSIAYLDVGGGRVWLVDIDWQDTDSVGDAFAPSRQLLHYMITHGNPQGYRQVGSFRINQGPDWSTPGQVAYSCTEACAMIFGGQPAEYACSTVDGELNHRAFADGWGDTQFCQGDGVADTFKLPVDAPYDCGMMSCSFSAYISDHGCDSVNYCWSLPIAR
jgi:hypothetical protein